MVKKNVLIKKDVIEKSGGVAILNLEKYRELEKKIAEYERKERLLKSLEKFKNLAKWGRNFAKKKRITSKHVLEND
jgi:hypothetical protein